MQHNLTGAAVRRRNRTLIATGLAASVALISAEWFTLAHAQQPTQATKLATPVAQAVPQQAQADNPGLCGHPGEWYACAP